MSSWRYERRLKPTSSDARCQQAAIWDHPAAKPLCCLQLAELGGIAAMHKQAFK
jgi:hypothetical protein